jgi:uncharacterized protein with von Willebrand factor type A (vWA) domain
MPSISMGHSPRRKLDHLLRHGIRQTNDGLDGTLALTQHKEALLARWEGTTSEHRSLSRPTACRTRTRRPGRVDACSHKHALALLQLS